MDAQTLIFLMSGIMFIAAFGFGYLPLKLDLSSKRVMQFTAIGAGVLISSAFLVVIPEGMEIIEGHEEHEEEEEHAEEGGEEEEEEGHEEEHAIEPSVLGMAMLVGFVVMLMLEVFGLPHAVHHDEDKDLLGISATIGLIIHAAADGLAIGASVSSSTETGLIVFVAIMLHKGPAAFGLASFLEHIKLEKQKSQLYLLIFALSSPIMAIVTFFALKDTTLATDENIGLALMFSAGTFIYVATVDVLPQVHSHEHEKDTTVWYVVLGMVLVYVTTLLSHQH
ncbi:MAG: hypothetical protein BEU04_02430 [Marine Group III euryarchaeote CG-Bathy1]|uniref:Zinc/iron permease n=1 Tax=Marine Group III euryarchaeote CG-Bathy1 TaxID=1889001 RepID=A0A1J5TND2_9ARCH|nr:MAG: hypothetical protein BEU04_02430 [Marine Group III euryarchaeote CG-Bathy1]